MSFKKKLKNYFTLDDEYEYEYVENEQEEEPPHTQEKKQQRVKML